MPRPLDDHTLICQECATKGCMRKLQWTEWYTYETYKDADEELYHPCWCCGTTEGVLIQARCLEIVDET